jgi:hypothetical protein
LLLSTNRTDLNLSYSVNVCIFSPAIIQFLRLPLNVLRTPGGTRTTGWESLSYVIDTEGPGHSVVYPPPTIAEVKESVELLPLWALVGCSRVKFIFTLLLLVRVRA